MSSVNSISVSNNNILVSGFLTFILTFFLLILIFFSGIDMKFNQFNTTVYGSIVQQNTMKALNQSINTTLNQPVSIQLKVAHTNSEAELDAKIILHPSHGSLSKIDPETGILTYIPDTDFIGDDRFTFYVTDGKTDSNRAEVEILVEYDKKNEDDKNLSLFDIPNPTKKEPFIYEEPDEPTF
jgi:hypothetical protein